jgi:hypothetical protein
VDHVIAHGVDIFVDDTHGVQVAFD